MQFCLSLWWTTRPFLGCLLVDIEHRREIFVGQFLHRAIFGKEYLFGAAGVVGISYFIDNHDGDNHDQQCNAVSDYFFTIDIVISWQHCVYLYDRGEIRKQADMLNMVPVNDDMKQLME